MENKTNLSSICQAEKKAINQAFVSGACIYYTNIDSFSLSPYCIDAIKYIID